MQDSGPDRLQSVLTEGIAIALGSAYLYLITFFYELGYCTHFGVPRVFIDPSLTTILVAAAAIGGLAFSSFYFFALSLPVLRAAINPSDSLKPYRYFLVLNAILLIFGILLWRVYGISWKGFLLSFALVLLLNAVYVAAGLIVYRSEKSLRERFEAISEEQADPFDIWEPLFQKFGRPRVGLVLVLVLANGVAYLVGNGEAVRQERFLVLQDSPDFVLVRSYGDVMIAAKVDRIKKTTGNDILLLRTSSRDKFEFRTETLGPLKKEIDVVASTDHDPSLASPEDPGQEIAPAVEKDAPQVLPSQ